jgi:hypothetical protein
MCFNSCTSLKTLTVENDSQLTHIERDAFLGCHSLASLTIPAAVDVTWDCLSAVIRRKGVSIDSASQHNISTNQMPEYIHFPQHGFPCAIFSDSSSERLEDEFELGYDQFLSLIDPSTALTEETPLVRLDHVLK